MNLILDKEHKIPGVWAEGSDFDMLLPDIANSVIKGQVISLRIANQPPYGYVFRVDKLSLIEKVWNEKRRVSESGKVDLKKKPVTSLSSDQIATYIDQEQLGVFGFNEKDIDYILDLNVHTILPVNNKVPEHLVTMSDDGNTISTIRFPEGDNMRLLVDKISEIDNTAIVGGTSLNLDSQEAITDSNVLVSRMSEFPKVDLFVLSDKQDISLELGAFHPMISLKPSRTIEIIRKGIGFEHIESVLSKNGFNLAV